MKTYSLPSNVKQEIENFGIVSRCLMSRSIGMEQDSFLSQIVPMRMEHQRNMLILLEGVIKDGDLLTAQYIGGYLLALADSTCYLFTRNTDY